MIDKSLQLYNRVVEAIDNKEFEVALEFLKSSLKVTPHFKTFHKLADVSVKLENHKDALDYFSQACSLNPKNDKAGFNYAKILVEHKE